MLCACDGGLAAAAEIDFQPHEWNLGLCLALFPVFASEMRSMEDVHISIFLADSPRGCPHRMVLFGMKCDFYKGHSHGSEEKSRGSLKNDHLQNSLDFVKLTLKLMKERLFYYKFNYIIIIIII
jgi:hypothetical protein